MKLRRLVLIGAVAMGVGCADGEPIDCGGPPEWSAVEASVVSASPISVDDNGHDHAEMTLARTDGSEIVLRVHGRPDLLREGETYRFRVDQYDEAFVAYSDSLDCSGEPALLTTDLDGAPIGE